MFDLAVTAPFTESAETEPALILAKGRRNRQQRSRHPPIDEHVIEARAATGRSRSKNVIDRRPI